MIALTVALIAAVLGPGAAYITAARKLSGRVATTDATELWKESASIRQDYRERLARADDELRDLRRRSEKLEAENARLGLRIIELERYVTQLGGEINGRS